MPHRAPRCFVPLLLAAALAGGQPPAAAPAFPDTPAGRRAAAFVAAFNDGSEAALRALVTGHWAAAALAERPVEQRVATLRRLRSDSGALEPARVDAAGEIEVAVLARAAGSGEWLALRVMVEPAPPHGIVGVRIEEAEPPAGAPGTEPLTLSQALSTLEAELAARAAADTFSGVVLVAKEGEPVWTRAHGLADRAFGVPNRPDTKFALGSINKVFTRLAVAQLAESGKLALDDPLAKHLPEYPDPDIARKVTIRQLVEHSSGLGDIFNKRYLEVPKDRLRTTDDFIALFVGEPLLFAPGSEQRYSNAGYVVLGKVIETLSGQSYHDYVRQRIYAPAGMADTDSYEADVPTPNLAEGYTRGEGGVLRSNVYTRPGRGSSAGGGYSTAEDLLRFAGALTAGKLAGPGWTAWVMGGPEPKPGEPAPAGPLPAIGAGGGAPGMNAVLEIAPDRGLVVVVLSNLDPPSAQEVARRARGLLARVR